MSTTKHTPEVSQRIFARRLISQFRGDQGVLWPARGHSTEENRRGVFASTAVETSEMWTGHFNVLHWDPKRQIDKRFA